MRGDKRKDEVSPKKRRDSLYEKRLKLPAGPVVDMTWLSVVHAPGKGITDCLTSSTFCEPALNLAYAPDMPEESQQEQLQQQSSLLVCSPVVASILNDENTTPSPGRAPRLTTATFVPPLRIRMRGGVTSSPVGDNLRLSTMTHAPQLRIRPFTSPGGGHVSSSPSPKLGMRIRPVTLLKKSTLPSPLARRGAAERAYLQGQLRAETLRRRKQEEHNAERKLREKNSSTSYLDSQIETMIEKFKVGFFEADHPPQRKGALHPYNASPPTILTKSFKRSVSAVLDDLDKGMTDLDIPDTNESLLFFPSGVPLLGHNEHAVGADIRLASEESSTNDEGFWQLGNDDSEMAMSSNPLSKKFITLRPKTNAPCDVTPTPIHSGNREDVTSTPNDPGRAKDDYLSYFPSGLPLLNEVDEVETNDFDGTACQQLGDKINGSDSFRLMYPVEKETVDTFPYIFTSPETLEQMTLSAHDNLPKYSIPESNYSTPDKRAHRLCRTQFWERMPKLPELRGINDVIDDSMLPPGIGWGGTRSVDDESQSEGSNLITPDDIQRGRKQVGWIRHLPKIMPTDDDISTDTPKISILESTSTPNIHTPRKHPNWSRAQSTEIASSTHRIDVNFHEEGTSNEAAYEEKEKPCVMTEGRLPFSQCIYSTPDTSY